MADTVPPEIGRQLFLSAPAEADSLIETLAEGRPANDDERVRPFARHRWEVVEPNAL
jgi:hypothetical protein